MLSGRLNVSSRLAPDWGFDREEEGSAKPFDGFIFKIFLNKWVVFLEVDILVLKYWFFLSGRSPAVLKLGFVKMYL